MKEGEDRKPAYLILGLVGASVLLASVVLLRPLGRGPAAARPKRAWPDQGAPRLLDPAMLPQSPTDSSIDMVTRPLEAAKGQEPPAEPGAGDHAARDPAARPAAGPGAGEPAPSGPTPLNPAEKSRLAGLAGGDLADPRKAAEIGGSNSGLWTKVMKAVSHYPRFMGYVLNNDHVVKAFMSDPKSRQFCQSPSAASAYMMDTKSPGGVSHAMDVVDTVLHGDPAMPGVVFGSKLADAMMACPTVHALEKDPVFLRSVAQANPRALQFLLDPTVMLGVASNPKVAAAYKGVQGSLPP